jgi:signal transduction histidine kinase
MPDEATLDREPTPGPGSPLAERVQGLLALPLDERSLRRLVLKLVEAVPAADSAVVLLSSREALEVTAAVGLDRDDAERIVGGLGDAVMSSGELALARSPGPPFPTGTRCGAGVPVHAGETRGALLLGSRTADAFDPEALALLGVAGDRASLALARGLLGRERMAAADVVQRAEAELASRRQALDFILGVVGHDLRNPLGAIHLSAALLHRRAALEGWQARVVERMRSSTSRMSRIIDDLLTYTRTRLGGGIPVRMRPARLDEIVRKVIDELSSVNPQRALQVDVEGDPSGQWDPDRLEQVVSNLVSNAVDHGDPAFPVRVEICGEPSAVELRIRNRGPQVPAEVLDHLFEPFARPPEEKSRRGSGLGLGLYIAREIVVSGHHGSIAVTSGEETVITVRLPRS